MNLRAKLAHFLLSKSGAFAIGALLAIIFFQIFYGLSLAIPTNDAWIWHGVTHDTAQHQLGWEFFRADSTGATINGLAAPNGLALTFMDAIPPFSLFFGVFRDFLPEHFQFFGLWALLCYILIGGLSALLFRRIFQKIAARENSKTKQSQQKNLAQIIFVAAGALIFIALPTMIARSLYHSALAAQWLILLSFFPILDAKNFRNFAKFVAVWSAILLLAVLIHPYFLPMLGAAMLISGILSFQHFSWRKIPLLIIRTLIPVVFAGFIFFLIGGFSVGSSAAGEFSDLREKGFNLLSFANPAEYSALIPGWPNASSSPETMMWFGLGIWLLLFFSLLAARGYFRAIFQKLKNQFAREKFRNFAILLVASSLLIFAIGVRVDFGPIALFEWQPPAKIYEVWSAFRAAAREAWPFYFATIFLAVFAAFHLFQEKFSAAFSRKNISATLVFSLIFLAISLVQFSDIFFSPRASEKRAGFSDAKISANQFPPPEIRDLKTTQRNLIMLDAGFRGDQSGTYKIGRAALENNLTLNTGFFARIPEEIPKMQKTWREKIIAGKVSASDFTENIFATKDEEILRAAEKFYEISARDDFHFIFAKKNPDKN